MAWKEISPRRRAFGRGRFARAILATIGAGVTLASMAQAPPPEFIQRVAEQYRAAMAINDRDKNGRLTREEVQGTVLLAARFDDIDANRDDVITNEELERFLSSMPARAS